MRIVVPAFRAARTLPRCILALTNCTGVRNSDIVVVDDGGNDNLARLLEPFHVRVVSTGGQHSAAKSRNRGAEGHRADVLVFVDADVEVDHDAIARLVHPIRTGKAGATVGNYSKNTNGLSFCQAYKQLYLSRVYSRHDSYLRNHFWTALCAIKSEIFAELTGFAETIEGTCDEDTELGQRMTQAGVSILAVPSATGRHIKPYNLKTLVSNDFRKGLNTIPLFFRKDVALTDNRHASRTDILAVALAGLTLALGVLVATHPDFRSPLALSIPFAYLALRSDLMAYFMVPGWFFLVRAIPLMYLLDVVRAVCVVCGLGCLMLQRLRAGLRHGLRRPALGSGGGHE